MWNKVKALMSMFKAKGYVGKIYSYSKSEDELGKIKVVLSGLNIDIPAIALQRLLKEKGLRIVRYNPIDKNKMEVVFAPLKEEVKVKSLVANFILKSS